MKVVIRADASLQIGTGHVVRCLTLAEALKLKGVEIEFICRSHEGNLIERIEQQGFRVHKLLRGVASVELNASPNVSETGRESLYGEYWLGATQEQDAEQCKVILDDIKPDWLIIDHYGIDEVWQGLLKESYKKLMVIDDLADRSHLCDLLLDQTYGREKEDYADIVPKNCHMLLGAQFALLRTEFAQWREFSLKRRANPELKKILITMGGVDPDNVTGQVLNALKACDRPEELEIIVVMGATSPNIEVVQKQVKEMPYNVCIKTNVKNMAELMANVDLAIGAAGATTWERCCLGVPSIQLVIAENQKLIAQHLLKVDAIKVLKGISNLHHELNALKNNMKMYAINASNITDGLGVKRVVRFLL